MEKLRQNKPLKTILIVIFLAFLPQQILFWKLCTEQDGDIPPNTEVLVSACKKPVAIGVPGGEVLFVYEDLTGKMYLLDLRTGEKRKIPNDPLLIEKGIFLSSELVWLEGSLVGPEHPNYRPHYILDLTNGERYELVDLKWQFPNKFLENGNLNPDLLLYFTSAEKIFIYHKENRLIALSHDFRQHLERNVIFPQASLGSAHLEAKNGELLEQLMTNLGVNYEITDLSLKYNDVSSPTGKYVVHYDGIYLSGTNTLFGDPKQNSLIYSFKSWYYDESGVVVQEVNPFLFTSPLFGSYYLIPTPILKLQLPSQ